MTTYQSHSNKIFLDEERRVNEKAFKLSKEYGKISNESIDPLTTAESLNLVEFQALINKMLIQLDALTNDIGDTVGEVQSEIKKLGVAISDKINIQWYIQNYNKLVSSMRKAYLEPTTSSIMKNDMQKLLPYLQILKDYYFGVIVRAKPALTTDLEEVLRSLNSYNAVNLMYDNINTNSYEEINIRQLQLNMNASISDFGDLRYMLKALVDRNPTHWEFQEIRKQGKEAIKEEQEKKELVKKVREKQARARKEEGRRRVPTQREREEQALREIERVNREQEIERRRGRAEMR